jgi:asparagine N-glycosylation enzyme membrane subunit Stt3
MPSDSGSSGSQPTASPAARPASPALPAWVQPVALVLVVLAGFAVRAAPASAPDQAGGLFFADGDSYYHLRRIEQTVAAGGQVPMFDPQLSYPDGQRIQWHGGYDLTIAAAVAVVCGSAPDRACMEAVAGWCSPLLGALAVLAVFFMARSVAGPPTALAAAALFALYPFSAGSARVDHVDHHAVEPLFPALWLWALARGRARTAGVLCGLSLAYFPSALWPIAVTSAGLLLLRLRDLAFPDAAPAGAHDALPRMLGTATLVALPIVATSGFATRVEPAATSLFHLIALGGGAAVAQALEWIARRDRRRALSRGLWLLATCGLVSLALGYRTVAPLLVFGQAQGLWLGVVQQAPLLDHLPGLAVATAIALSASVIAYGVGRRRRARGLQLLALINPPLFAAGALQIRFLMVASPVLTTVLACALIDGGAALRSHVSDHPRRVRAMAAAVLVLAWMLVLLPIRATLSTRPPPRVQLRLHDGARLLSRLRGQLDPHAAVWSDWLWGHHVLYFGGLPTVASPFILSGRDDANVQARRALLFEDSDELLAAMRRRDASYLLVSDGFDVAQAARSLGLPPPREPVVDALRADPPWPEGLELMGSEGGVRLFRRVSDIH